ncbi:DUF445 domain-containing protein [Thalassobacillus devorans]|uniref:DUF445 domain-containing protein n=1 Tax=Thalassobacillus devorans TaxID=279813 RepID=UPI00048F9BD9|nr:DUF445 family protein [Thalassobacillus devorans]
MNVVLLILMMMAIGALIGGLTNSLAIKMLFRPYKAKYIGKYRLPFTPGLIPKRQQELARQLGRMVVQHLLTAEGIRKKLEESEFQRQMTLWVQDEVKQLLKQEKKINELLDSFEVNADEGKLRRKISYWVENQYEEMMTQYRAVPVEELLPENWKKKADKGVDKLAANIQLKLSTYIDSPEGKRKISELIEHYLTGQGFLGNMISSFITPQGLTDKAHPAVLQYVRAPETKEWLVELIGKEKDYWVRQPVGTIEEKVGKNAIKRTLGTTVAKTLPLENWLNRTVADWVKPIRSKIIQDAVPVLVAQAGTLLADRIEPMMKKLHLAEIVQDQVEAFSIGRLEAMVLDISRRELKMITYLGALLGGLIGIIQGVIVLILG